MTKADSSTSKKNKTVVTAAAATTTTTVVVKKKKLHRLSQVDMLAMHHFVFLSDLDLHGQYELVDHQIYHLCEEHQDIDDGDNTRLSPDEFIEAYDWLCEHDPKLRKLDEDEKWDLRVNRFFRVRSDSSGVLPRVKKACSRDEFKAIQNTFVQFFTFKN